MRFFNNPRWKYVIVKRAVKKAFGVAAIQRDKDLVEKEYTAHWHDYRRYRKPRIALRGNTVVVMYGIDFTKSSVWYVTHLIRSLGITSVLELGSGNGLLIWSLKVLNPSVDFTGVELTDAGIAAARDIRERHGDLLTYITEKNEKEINALLDARRAPVFKKGDITQLDFPDGAFDLVFSSVVIEQLPRRYREAFVEAHRVTRRYACFIEEFSEAQKNIFQRLTLWVQDYFRESYHTVERAGFTVLSFDLKEIDKASHSVGMVVCEKK